MKSRPTLFLSGVSHEFSSFRDAVENEIEMKGCFAENQPGFPPDYRTVEEMLRRKLKDSDAVIHIVGFRFGARAQSAPRRQAAPLLHADGVRHRPGNEQASVRLHLEGRIRPRSAEA